jgi:hypothetical protein
MNAIVPSIVALITLVMVLVSGPLTKGIDDEVDLLLARVAMGILAALTLAVLGLALSMYRNSSSDTR